MTPNERRTRLLKLGAEQRALEAKAGLTERMEEAAKRTYAAKQITRDAYFSVTDPELRRTLIEKHLQCDSECEELMKEEVEHLQPLEGATSAADRLPWAWAAIVAIVPVAVGTAIAGIPGALGGAVAGFFLGARRDPQKQGSSCGCGETGSGGA